MSLQRCTAISRLSGPVRSSVHYTQGRKVTTWHPGKYSEVRPKNLFRHSVLSSQMTIFVIIQFKYTLSKNGSHGLMKYLTNFSSCRSAPPRLLLPGAAPSLCELTPLAIPRQTSIVQIGGK